MLDLVRNIRNSIRAVGCQKYSAYPHINFQLVKILDGNTFGTIRVSIELDFNNFVSAEL